MEFGLFGGKIEWKWKTVVEFSRVQKMIGTRVPCKKICDFIH
jgi:hypothetical protein